MAAERTVCEVLARTVDPDAGKRANAVRLHDYVRDQIRFGFTARFDAATPEETLADGSSTLLDDHFGALGGWIASTLVRLGDLGFEYFPADDDDAD